MMGKILLALMLICAVSTASAEQPDEVSLKAFLRGLDKSAPHRDARYVAAFSDLNGDGKPEVIVRIIGDSWCGSSGCSTFVLHRRGGAWKVQSEISVTQLTVTVLPHRSHGWHDLTVGVCGGGILECYDAVLAFDGKRYPYNPTMPPARKARPGETGAVLIPNDGAKALPLYGD